MDDAPGVLKLWEALGALVLRIWLDGTEVQLLVWAAQVSLIQAN